MPNELTGDFDIVAQFAVGTVNRMLAAMHRAERFPHSATLRVDDIAPPTHGYHPPVLTAVLDSFGDAIVNHQRIGRPDLRIPASVFGTGARVFDPIINPGFDLDIDPLPPSNLQGRAQVQLFPPTLEAAATTGSSLSVRLEMLVRYFPDPGTARAAEFVRGALTITAPLDANASSIADIIELDLRSSAIQVAFTPQWTSSPLTPQDRAGIDILIKNALRSSFLPSSVTLPAGTGMQFRMIPGANPAASLLMNADGHTANAASVSNVFLSGNDNFAFAVGADFIRAKFQPILDSIRTTPIAPVKFRYSTFIHTWNITYTVTLNSATVDLQNGRIVMTITGHAHTGTSWMPDFDFTVTQPFSLAPSGSSAELIVEQMSISTSSWVINLFKGGATESMTAARDKALVDNDAFATVRQMLSADEKLGGFLQSILAPPEGKPISSYTRVDLAYSSIEIRPAGIVLHGSLGVADWQPPRVEYEKLPPDNSGPFGAVSGAVNEGPDYSALNSWIPGGSVDSYEWSPPGATQPYVDANRFVFLHPPMTVSDGGVSARLLGGHSPFCLTINGHRISSSGPATTTNVRETACFFRLPPLFDELLNGDGPPLLVAISQPGRDGRVAILGHTSASAEGARGLTPNVLLHFGTRAAGDAAERLVSAMNNARRGDAPTSVVVIAPAGSLEEAQYVEGVTYAEDDGSWSRRFDVNPGRPTTVLLDPGGKTVWRNEGEVNADSLSSALKKHLVARSPVRTVTRGSFVRVGQRASNFLMDYAPGKRITLRKLEGRHVKIVFLRGDSTESFDALRAAIPVEKGSSDSNPIVIGILDTESKAGSKRGSAAGAIMVTDHDRMIAGAYGIAIWPTTISIDSAGIVRGIQYGKEISHATSGARGDRK